MKLDFLKPQQMEFLREGKYIQDDETPQQRFKEIVDKIREYESDYSEGLADRIEYMLDKNILSLSTPVLANFGKPKKEGKNTHPLPASCYIVTVGDSIDGIYDAIGQVAVASKLGGGVGSDFQMVTQKGTKIDEGFYSNSKLDWIEDSVGAGQKVSQSSLRRGYNTPFISIDDNDFDGLMDRISKTNPDKKDRLINNTVGIILPIGFREKLLTDKEAQRRYLKVLTERKKTGRIYILDEKNSNNNSSPVYKKLGLSVKVTNICTEFLNILTPDLTSVCVISAMNLVHWDEIKSKPQMIKDGFMFLDIVNQEYIKLSEGVRFLEKAHKSAKEKADIGLGTLGLAELFQMKGYAYGDMYSRALNKEIFKTIREAGEEVTYDLGSRLGSPKYCEMAGMVRRNCSLMMVAPNKSTSFISGETSGGIEPFMSNVFFKSLAKIQYVWKNKHLEALLEKSGKNNSVIWGSIEDNNGSIQHLDFLDDYQKSIFRTFSEISPKDMIDLASDRQEFIDMGQSLNLMFRKNYTIKDIYDIHKYAWDKDIKTLYYAYNSAHAALEKDGEKWDNCVSCSD